MTISVEPTAEQVLHRSRLALLKDQIKTDAVNIRAHKREIRDQQKALGSGSAAGFQSNLYRERIEARARLLIYGTLRGRTWDRMEPKHAAKTANLRYYIARVWNALIPGEPLPEALQEIA